MGRLRTERPQPSSQLEATRKITKSKPIPHIPLPFKEVMADVLKMKPPEKKAEKRAHPKVR